METTINKLQDFALKHKLILEQKGEIGFGRPCVGFLHGDNFIAYNPMNDTDYSYIFGAHDERMAAPSGVDSYHKGDYMAVLVSDDDYDKALRDLLVWVEHLESQGEVEVVEYNTGATGMQAIISGLFGRAIKLKETNHANSKE